MLISVTKTTDFCLTVSFLGGGAKKETGGGKKVWKSVKPVLFLLVQTENACITKEKYIQTEHGSLFNK